MSRWDLYEKEKPFSALVGKTITAIHGDKDSAELRFECSDGSEYLMYHSQDCCENVSIAEVIGTCPIWSGRS